MAARSLCPERLRHFPLQVDTYNIAHAAKKKNVLLFFPSLQVVFSAPYHQVDIRPQDAASGKIVERCADDSEKDRHEITALSELRRKCPQPETEQRA